MNILGVKEFEGDGKSCPIIPISLPLHKRILLLFFRFGICPICMTMSIAYAIRKKIVNERDANK